MAKYKIYEDKKHHLGLISEDGEHKTPAVYDEIQIKEDGIWHCRAYVNWDYFYPSTGKFSIMSRNNSTYGSKERVLLNGNKSTTVGDRKFYDSISVCNISRFVTTYKKGKFGVKFLDGTTILDALYDEVIVWQNANVILTRLGNKYRYFNELGEQILTDKPSCMEENIPYCDGPGLHKFMVREIVDHASDNHTYVSDAGFVRIDRMEVNEAARMLEANCERIPMKREAIETLTDRYSYEFGMSIIRLNADADGTITEDEWKTAANKLETIGSFQCSWFCIDKFVTNSKTRLSVKSFYWLKHQYDMMYEPLNDLCIAYGIDDTLADGEVKWIHVEHYNEHSFPEDYGVCDAMIYNTLDELKELIESHDWEAEGEPYGGCFFSYSNMIYAKEREWEETEKILNYMYELGHKPEGLITHIANSIHYGSNTAEEMDFWVKCAEWALSRCDFPNEIHYGQTCYSLFLDTDIESEPIEVQTKIKELGELFLSHGARTSEQQIEADLQNLNSVTDPYDYSIIDTW